MMKTWRVTGTNLNLLTKQLHATEGIDQVITFFNSLHVSSRNADELDNAVKPYLNNPNFTWEVIESSLDDAFIWLSRNRIKDIDNK